MSLGPVEYIVVAFPGNKFEGNILPALGDLVKSGTIRVMDLAVVKKETDGSVRIVEVEDLAGEEAETFAFEKAIGDLLNEEDLLRVAEELEPNSSAAALVWESLWAKPFTESIREAEGVLVDYERIPYETVQAAIDYAETLKD